MFNRNRGDCQHFPSELGPITEVTAPRPSSQDGAVDHHSSSSVESSTERLTAIPRNTTSPAASPRMGRFRLADSRSSNRSETPVTPSPPGSGNNSPNIRGTRQQSAISRDSIRSQTPNEDLNPSADRSSLHVPQSQPFAALSQPPPTPPATASNKVRLVINIYTFIISYILYGMRSETSVQYIVEGHHVCIQDSKVRACIHGCSNTIA